METFGIPLLEAIAMELPVVAADIPVFREISGDAALYADPHDEVLRERALPHQRRASAPAKRAPRA